MENWFLVIKPLLKANQVLAVNLKRTNTYITQKNKTAVSNVSKFLFFIFAIVPFLKYAAYNPGREFTVKHEETKPCKYLVFLTSHG